MVLRPPCGNPECPDPAKASGQWQYIPAGFEKQVREDATCTCKKANCLRYFGLKDLAGKPGRKRAHGGDDGDDSAGQREPCIPAKYIVNRVETIVSCRCVRPCPLPSAPRLE